MRGQAEAFHERREAVLDLDLGRSGLHRLGVKVIQHKARFRAKRQADIDEVLDGRVERPSRLDL